MQFYLVSILCSLPCFHFFFQNHRNETKIDQLQKQLSETTKRLEDINNELESLKIRGEGKTEEIRLEYEAKINEEKRKALRAEQDARFIRYFETIHSLFKSWFWRKERCPWNRIWFWTTSIWVEDIWFGKCQRRAFTEKGNPQAIAELLKTSVKIYWMLRLI